MRLIKFRVSLYFEVRPSELAMELGRPTCSIINFNSSPQTAKLRGKLLNLVAEHRPRSISIEKLFSAVEQYMTKLGEFLTGIDSALEKNR
jgi:hypothetical protein